MEHAMEHRWGQRTRLALSVSVRHVDGDSCTNGETADISMSGALICTRLEVAPDEAVEVQIDGHWIRAWVTRRAGPAIGVEWMGLSPAAIVRRINSVARAAHLAPVPPASSAPERPVAP